MNVDLAAIQIDARMTANRILNYLRLRNLLQDRDRNVLFLVVRHMYCDVMVKMRLKMTVLVRYVYMGIVLVVTVVRMVLLLKVLHDRGKGALDCSESLCERSDDMVSTVQCEDIDVVLTFPWRCMRREVPLDTQWPARYATALAI